ncbi:PAS domain-containing protein, partial [Planococcus sp. SIMBA_160]
LWLIEHEPADDAFRYRLAGESINATFGFSLRGKRLDEVAEPHILATVRARFLHVLNTPGAVHATGRVYARTGRYREGERIVLPLA